MSRYPTVPVCRPYHPLSDLRTRSGYYPNISPDQLKAVNELSALLQKNDINIKNDEEDDFLKLLRFLRARKFMVAKAFELLQKDAQWRSEENRMNIRNESASDSLACDAGNIIIYFPSWIQGYDKQQRPVSYRQFGRMKMWEMLKFTTIDRLVRFHIWETEQALRLMYEKSAVLNNNIETFTIVFDAAGWTLKLATADAYTFIKGLASVDSDHYPERLGVIIIINAPAILSVAWKVVSGFLDDVTKTKIKIFPASKSKWFPVLLKYIDIDQIPEMYGGTSPNPNLAETFSSEKGTTIEVVEEEEMTADEGMKIEADFAELLTDYPADTPRRPLSSTSGHDFSSDS